MVLSYEGKLILAPMVRVGSLPMRLLALEYGADLVYGPETVDKKLISTERRFNSTKRSNYNFLVHIVEVYGTYDYICDKNSLIFRTHPSEKGRLVFQLGTADPALALKAALHVAQDVSGIDVNCGCPKRFSVQAGMGAALLKEPEKLERILRTLVEGLPSSISVSAKIRLLPTVEETIGLAKRLSATGIKALTLHARTPEMRPHHPALWEVFSQVARAIAPIPLIANGDFYTQECVQKGRATLEDVSSFMIGRGAQWNVSVFRPEGPLPLITVSEAYLRKAAESGALVSNAKFTLLQMWMGAQEQDVDGAKVIVKALQAARSYEALGDVFGIQVAPPACSEELIEASAED